MTGWEPATEAEVALREALRAQDQQHYFRILTRLDLLLPVSAEALAGQAPMGWGTWSTGGRTHVLAFTSSAALRACLGENAGPGRRVPYADLAAGWPNHEWWLAVNPGLPIEGYLPAWYVAQLSRGDVRLPGRTMGARARLERVETAARAASAASGRDAPVAGAPSGRHPLAPVPGTHMPATAGEPPAPGRAAPAVVPGGAGWGNGRAEPGPPAAHTAEPANGRPGPAPLRPSGEPDGRDEWARHGGPAELPRRPEEPLARAGHAGAPGPPPARSFFEPAARRPFRRPAPLDPVRGAGERAELPDPARPADGRVAPPSRFAGGVQPFPRRRPLTEPVPADATQAFQVDGGETTRAIPPAEPDRPFQPAAPPAADDTSHSLPRRRPRPDQAAAPGGGGADPGERTQPIPGAGHTAAFSDRLYGRSTEAEELPPSAAEPVSGPPGSRRDFSPIVIEGTIIESRDLTEPARPTVPDQPSPARPEPGPFGPAADRIPSDQVPPADRIALGERTRSLFEPVAPPADATVPLSQPDMSSGDVTVSLSEPVASHAETTAPLFERGGPPPERPGSLFEPAVPGSPGSSPRPSGGTADEPTAPLAGSATSDEPTAPLAGSATSDEPTAPLAGSATSDEPTAPLARSATSDEPAVPNPPASGPGPALPADAGGPSPAGFRPANEVEEDLLGAAGSGSTDSFLTTLLLARVLLPVAADSAPGSRPGDPGFVWRTEELDGEPYVVVYTSPERLADRVDGPVETVRVKFVQLIRRWPNETWSFAVNPGTPVGAKYPGEQVLALANWAAEVGLGDDPESEPEQPAAEPAAVPRPAAPANPTRPVTMQKAIAPSQLAYYLERGYDRVSGFVHRATELAHLQTPAQLYDALGLGHPGSPFSRDAGEIYVLRWPAYRPSLYRIPYGGQNEAAMRAMEGWVIERPPFRGNGFAPGESRDVIAEFKVDSARLPHGAQLWRIGADGSERLVANLDADTLAWHREGDES